VSRKRKADTERRKRTASGQYKPKLPARTKDLRSADRWYLRELQSWHTDWLVEDRNRFRAELDYITNFTNDQDSLKAYLTQRKLNLIERELKRRKHDESKPPSHSNVERHNDDD